MEYRRRYQPYLIWACAALFYMYQFILRVSPSVMMEDLMAHFQISASTIGTLSALALYAYSFLQIPAGVLVDVFGVRRVILTSLLLCLVGTFLFISTPNLLIAKLGRILLGSGSAAAFLSLSKLSTQLFSPNKRATLFGLAMAAGTIGALNGGVPLSYLITEVGWRESLAVTLILGLLILVLNAIFLRDALNPNERTSQRFELRHFMTPILEVIKVKACWISGFAALGIYLSASVIADLWGVNFLMQSYQVSKPVAAQAVSFIYIGLCIGSLTLTVVSDYLRRRKLLIFVSTLGILVGLALVVYVHHLPFSVVGLLLFVVGFFSGAEMLCFASASEFADSGYAGTVTGFINFIVMVGGAILQQQVGRLLDLFWQGNTSTDGLRLYTIQEYELALSLPILMIFFSAIAALCIPETVQKKQA